MTDGYLWFEGLPFPSIDYSYEGLKEACTKFVIKDEDTVMVSYPKSGTHWLIEILCLIHSKGDTTWIRSVSIWDRAPWLEIDTGYKLLKEREGPRFLTSHLPFYLFPKSFFTSKAKVIYIMRNPKDVLVSGYYFWTTTKFSKKPESLDQYFQWFLQGHVPYGSWFEHIRGWMSMRDRENVLLLSYEELQKVTSTSPGNLADGDWKSWGVSEPEVTGATGICGDWKNHLTVAQAEALDKLYQEKMAGFPKELFPWE
uniref:Sulfotransferase n=1 Tax=Marmota marmota marmota TaxID=9994 RepID=A0A8C5ZK04_MARMA